MKRARRNAGYTLLEVMFAVSVLMVGTAGFTLMQGASARAIRNAQEHTVALQVLEGWIDRVRRDASLWTAPGVANMTLTTHLRAGANAWGQWITPATYIDPDSNVIVYAAGSDAWGWDRAAGQGIRNCVKLRYRVAHWTQSNGVFIEDTVRADVLVWRPRPAGGPLPANAVTNRETNCAADVASLLGPSISRASASILVRWE